MTALVVGGAGYIGSHVVAALSAAGEDVWVLDDLSTGDITRVDPEHLLRLDVTAPGAQEVIAGLIARQSIDTVYHFAAKKQAEESVREPLEYYRVNIDGLRSVLQATVAGGARNIVFSSSAAVYGETGASLVTESDRPAPINPYGGSKLAGEWLVRDVARAHGLAAASLRYFNVAGTASPLLADRGRSNLIPQVLDRIAHGQSPRVFGTDYPTPDGTCVRDFVHVVDLADAHVFVADYLRSGVPGYATLNVGTGRGYSVREVVDRALDATGRRDLHAELSPRRPGDPAMVVADGRRIRELGWTPRLGLDEMITSSWKALNG